MLNSRFSFYCYWFHFSFRFYCLHILVLVFADENIRFSLIAIFVFLDENNTNQRASFSAWPATDKDQESTVITNESILEEWLGLLMAKTVHRFYTST